MIRYPVKLTRDSDGSLQTGTRKSDLARGLDVHPPQIDRLLDHDSRRDQIENAARAMGREINIELVPAA
jgi:antitoxin HicB